MSKLRNQEKKILVVPLYSGPVKVLVTPPCGASSNIALWRAKIKPPVELVVGDYIRPQLRLSSVTIVLIGAETGGRWWVDWEIYCSLRKSAGNERNGILGILIPNKQHNIPQRILDNPDNSEIITMPKSAKELEDAIERVYLKRYHAPNLTRPLRQRNSHI